MPDEVKQLLEALLRSTAPGTVALHFHDTYGHAVENALAGWRMGIEAFDSSAGGIGGCPHAPGASGNVATEALVESFRAAGADVPGDLGALAAARRLIAPALGRSSG